MLIDPEGAALAPGQPDPATPERRAELAREMLAATVRRYEEVARALCAAEESFPHLDPPRAPAGEAEREERRAWQRLIREANDDFDSAEFALADRIQGLFDLLAPEGRKADRGPDDYFIPRAIRHGGYVYVLADSVGRYEPRSNFIAVYPETMLIDLDGGAVADEA